MNTFLQIFLLINVFAIGGLVAIGIQHAYAHFKPVPNEIKKTNQSPQSLHLPNAIREHLLQESQTKFQAVMDRSAAELEHDLNVITERIDKQIEKFGTEIVNDEIKRYRQHLDELCKQTGATITNAQTEIYKHQADIESKINERRSELETKLNEEIAAEKQRLIQQIDTKLGDAVASFLVETLGHNVDLGAQNEYLTKMLDEHKEDLKKELQ